MKPRTGVLTLTGIALITMSVVAAETVSVIVKKTSIREARQFFATTVTEAEYRDQLTVLATDNDWIKVDRNGAQGWIHISAVAAISAVEPRSTDEINADYSSDEIALAGKGFSRQVEEQYRAEHPQLNFIAVDEMEKTTVSRQKVIAFQDAGKLSVRETAP